MWTRLKSDKLQMIKNKICTSVAINTEKGEAQPIEAIRI